MEEHEPMEEPDDFDPADLEEESDGEQEKKLQDFGISLYMAG